MGRTTTRGWPRLWMIGAPASAVLLAVSCASGPPLEPITPAPDDPELRERLDQLAAAYESLDVARILDFYSEDPFSVSYDLPYKFDTSGEQHRDTLARFLGQVSQVDVEFGQPLNAWRTNDRAWTTRPFTASGTLAGGETFSFDGWHSAIWTPRDGTWRIAYEHFGGSEAAFASPMPPPAPPAVAAAVPASPTWPLKDAFFDYDRFEIRDDQRAGLLANADWLKANQKPEGYWVGRLESNACMEAQWILCLWFLGLGDHHLRPRLAASLRKTQRADGSWEIYHDAPAGDINTTVEAYAALRSCGVPASDPQLLKARDWILSKGGHRNIRVFTRYWLALIGEWPWEKTPNIPPEVIHFPKQFIFSIYNFAQWARATLMPIAVLSGRRPSRPLRPENALDDLFPGGRASFDYELPGKPGADFWDGFFRTVDKILHRMQTFGDGTKLSFGRNGSVKRALEWIIEHQDADGVWGGIQPPWIYSTMATGLKFALGKQGGTGYIAASGRAGTCWHVRSRIPKT